MTISEKLSQIKERDKDAHGIGRDHHMIKSQADVLPLLETVEAVMQFMEETPYGAHGDYGPPMVHTDDIHRIIEHHLGGGDDE